jgi:hypothetical protein
MFKLGRTIAFASVLFTLPALAVASNPSTVPGTWRKLPRAPFAVPTEVASVWTGRRLIVFGRRNVTALDVRGNPYIVKSVDVAEAFDPAANTWTRLSPSPGPDYVPGYEAVWTGKQMLVFGAFQSVAFTPATNTWHELRKSVPGGIVVWTGREAIGWGGGCCGDAQSNGSAYNPATGIYRNLPRSPLVASQEPLGVWTGRELIILVSGFGPDGKPSPARLARAAAYNPATNTWRRIAPLPVSGMRFNGTAVWDGRELLVVGAGKTAQSAYAYNPVTNRWRRLAPLPSGRFGASVVWTGRRLLLWGGQIGRYSKLVDSRDGLAYDPKADRWSTIPRWPLPARGGSSFAWTGRALIVWGGGRGVCKPGGIYGCHTEYFADGAAFTPTTP